MKKGKLNGIKIWYRNSEMKVEMEKLWKDVISSFLRKAFVLERLAGDAGEGESEMGEGDAATGDDILHSEN